jgi:hypothetical protein
LTTQTGEIDPERPADCLIRDRDSRFTAACADRTDPVLSVIARRVSSQPLTGAEYRAAEY